MGFLFFQSKTFCDVSGALRELTVSKMLSKMVDESFDMFLGLAWKGLAPSIHAP